VTAAREAALAALNAVTRDGAYTALALKKHLPVNLSPEDKRFASLLVRTTLENLLRIDFALSAFIKSARGALRNILRLGACQLLILDTQNYAAVSESVALAKKFKPHSAGFVNAALRALAEGKDGIKYPEGKTAYALSIRQSCPLWICEKYISDFGYEFAEALLGAKASTDTHVRMNPLKTNKKDFEAALDKYGLSRKESGAEDGYYIGAFLNIENTSLFADGLLAVQSKSAMRAVEAVGIKPSDKLLDCCAAPGGKSAYAAALTGGGVDITAWDIHPHRVEMMKKNFERLGVKAKTALRDAREAGPRLYDCFDVVLIDAPCSAMGLMAGSPDIRYKRKKEDIEALPVLQRNLLKGCAGYVKAGGKLAYMTCSVNREENEGVIDAFLESANNFSLEKPAVTLYPHICGSDGFFYAVMRKQ